MQPTQGQYCEEAAIAGPFENRVLYSMCKDYPLHDEPYVTAGKITAIGRIYAAAPERGAGKTGISGTLANAIGHKLAVSELDEKLSAIDFNTQFSPDVFRLVTGVHKFLMDQVDDAIRSWSSLSELEGWKPRKQGSFASKYLHFHRPNAFPIMDKYARAGLACGGVKGSCEAYPQFCEGLLAYVSGQSPRTLRAVDTELVDRGRVHLNREPPCCPICKVKYVRRAKRGLTP